MTDFTRYRLNCRVFIDGTIGATFSGKLACAVGDSFLTSRDGGVSWLGKPGPDQRPVAITAHPARPNRLIVALEGGGVAISSDAPGANFAVLSHGLPAVEGVDEPDMAPLPAGEPVRALVFSSTAPERLWAVLRSGGWASLDADVTWDRLNALDAIALCNGPSNSHNLVDATPGGLIHSKNAGVSWAASAAI